LKKNTYVDPSSVEFRAKVPIAISLFKKSSRKGLLAKW
jgi:hypothetical protein